MDINLWTWEFQGGPFVLIHCTRELQCSPYKQVWRSLSKTLSRPTFFGHTLYTTCFSKYSSWQPKGNKCIIDINLWTWEFQGGPSVLIHSPDNYSVQCTVSYKRYGEVNQTHFPVSQNIQRLQVYNGHRSENLRVSSRSRLYRFIVPEIYGLRERVHNLFCSTSADDNTGWCVFELVMMTCSCTILAMFRHVWT